MRTPTPDNPFPTVVLRHEQGGGKAHFDWFLAEDPHGAQPLASFRCDQRPDGPFGPAGMPLSRQEPHRGRYLDYEGPIGEDRGHVRCVARGWIEGWNRLEGQWTLAVRWSEGSMRQIRITFADDGKARLAMDVGILHNDGVKKR